MTAPANRHPGGRPPKFETPEAMQTVIDEYFAKCDPHVEEFKYFKRDEKGKYKLVSDKRITEQRPYTMSGLAEALDMDRRTLVNYAHKDEFLPTIKKARRKVEVYVETLMLNSNGVVAGVIFNAKNNFAWIDEQKIKGEFNTTQELTPEALAVLAKASRAKNGTTESN